MRQFTRRSLGALTASTMAVATFAAVVFSVLSADLIAEFGVERWQIGILVTATGVTGALLSPTFGRVTDRIGPVAATRGVLICGVFFISFIAIAPAYGFLAAAAVLTGIPQGWCNPATNALIVANVDPGTRGVITGIKQSGVQAGTFLGGLLLGPLTELWGWRPAILVFLTVPLLALVAMRGRAESAEFVSRRERARDPVPTAVVWVAVYGAMSGLASSSMFTFLPLFAREDQGWTAAAAGFLVAGVGLVGVISRISWGSVSERWLGHGLTLRLLAVQAMASAVLLTLVSTGTLGSWAMAPAAFLLGSGAVSWNAVGMLAVMDFSPPELVGRSTGVVLLGFLLGYGIGPPLLGLSVDRLGSYTPGWLTIAVLFAGCTLVAGRVSRTGTLAHS
ncbi:MAG: MFS transporter [Acidimicrobiia bacterium]